MWPLCMTILVLGLSCSVYTEHSCPSYKDIFPCTCNLIVIVNPGDEPIDLKHEIDCRYKKKTGDFETLQKAMRSLSGKNDVSLRLYGYNISMPSKLFSGMDIKELIFKNCHLYSSINDDQPWFSGLENKLTELIIDNSVKLPENLNIGKLDKLQSLIIRRNDIRELEDGIFSDGFSSLEYLAIFENGIEKIGSNVFSKLNNLKTLELEDENFVNITRSMLPTKPNKLERLLLDKIGFTELPEDIFTGMPSLEWLSLKDNRIRTLDERTFSPIWQQLDAVYLYGNNIMCDERLNWILKLKKLPRDIHGVCYVSGKWEDLQDFFERGIQ